MDIPIYDITPFTSMDFPGHLACVVWVAGCNMRCAYCHNPEIVNAKTKNSKPISELLNFLQSRKGLLGGVVISGGECTLYPDIVNLCKIIKEMGFKIKIDTNGSRFQIVKELAEQNLADYFAIDFKAPKEKYKDVTNINSYESLIKTIKFLSEKNQNFELRTTVHTDLLGADDINNIISTLKNINYNGTYYIQNFTFIDKTLGNIKEQKRVLDLSKINRDINIAFRNFV